MTDGAAGLYIVLCECMCEGKEGDRGRESGGGGDVEGCGEAEGRKGSKSSLGDRDVRQQMRPIKHMGRFLRGVTDPCFLDRGTQVCP